MKKWEGCYDDSWKGIIVDEAFRHPAKFSKALVERIIDYMLEKGWLQKGEVIGDTFGGVGLGGIIAAYRGLQWCGVELEEPFVGFGHANFQKHVHRWSQLGLPIPILIQGDSRNFDQVLLQSADAMITSPPYVSGGHHNDVFDAWNKNSRGQQIKKETAGYGKTKGQIGTLKEGEVDAVVTSPPFQSARSGTTNSAGGIAKAGYTGKGKREPKLADRQPHIAAPSAGSIEGSGLGSVDAVISSPPFGKEGTFRAGKFKDPEKMLKAKRGKGCSDEARRRQLARDEASVMPCSDGQIADTKIGKVDAVLTSPPYEEIAAGAGGLNTKPAKHAGQQSGRKKSASQSADQHYGKTEGQIGRARKGKVDAVLTSPPYENSVNREDHGFDFMKCKPDYPTRNNHPRRVAMHTKSHKKFVYGKQQGQIGALKKQTYWEAMLQVYSAMYRSLKPGGVAVLVVKDFVRAGKRMPLCDDTVRLLEHIGFETLERIHAMLTREYIVPDLFEGATIRRKERKSFFRRTFESKMAKDDPRRIDWEEVIFMRKP